MTLKEWLKTNNARTYFWNSTKSAGMGIGDVDTIEHSFKGEIYNANITLKDNIANLYNGMTFKILSSNIACKVNSCNETVWRDPNPPRTYVSKYCAGHEVDRLLRKLP